MDSYTVWWEVTAAMVVISGLAGALTARPASRSIGLIFGGIAATYAILNLLGSLKKDPHEAIITTAVAIFITVFMLVVFLAFWLWRRRHT